jgi:hypothetical protein
MFHEQREILHFRIPEAIIIHGPSDVLQALCIPGLWQISEKQP